MKMINFTSDLWDYLAAADKNILMYGMGNGAEKILAVCTEKGIRISDFFASDGFVRGHFFHGKRVLSYTEAKEHYGAENIIVLLSFATCLDTVIENIEKIATECELYAPDVPVSGNSIFNLDFYKIHAEDIKNTRSLFADESSTALYDDIIRYKLTGKINYLTEKNSEKSEVYNFINSKCKIKNAADFGAYNGDTVREIIKFSPDIKKIIALESDPKNFKKLSAYCEVQNSEFGQNRNIMPLLAAVWDNNGSITIESAGNRNSNITENADFKNISDETYVKLPKKDGVKIPSRTADSIFEEYGFMPDYIKYDVEGSEYKALLGTRKTIEHHAPALLISLYHRSEDIFFLPKIIKEMQPNYDMRLFKFKYIPAWEIVLICTKIK